MSNGLPPVEAFFPFWQELPEDHREDLLAHSQPKRFAKGEVILPYQGECLGLMLIQQGQLRAFVLSEAGKEVTLYRLSELDICLFTASCAMNNIQFDIQIEVEKDTEALLVPTQLYNRLQGQSIMMANYANQLMASRFTDVMWTLEQIVFKSMDSRLAQALLSHASLEQTDTLAITHEVLARDLGTAREVVTRLLKYFRNEGLLALTRGQIHLLKPQQLGVIAGS